MFAEEFLEFGIERHIGAIVVKEIELDVLVARTIELSGLMRAMLLMPSVYRNLVVSSVTKPDSACRRSAVPCT